MLLPGENTNARQVCDLAAYSGWLQATVSRTRSPFSWATPFKSPGEDTNCKDQQNPTLISPVRRMSVVATITPGPLSYMLLLKHIILCRKPHHDGVWEKQAVQIVERKNCQQ